MGDRKGKSSTPCNTVWMEVIEGKSSGYTTWQTLAVIVNIVNKRKFLKMLTSNILPVVWMQLEKDTINS